MLNSNSLMNSRYQIYITFCFPFNTTSNNKLLHKEFQVSIDPYVIFAKPCDECTKTRLENVRR